MSLRTLLMQTDARDLDTLAVIMDAAIEQRAPAGVFKLLEIRLRQGYHQVKVEQDFQGHHPESPEEQALVNFLLSLPKDSVFCPRTTEPYSSNCVWPADIPFPYEIDRTQKYAEVRFQQSSEWGRTWLMAPVVEVFKRGLFFYPERALCRPREAGYHYEGRVSIRGTSTSAFTGSVHIDVGTTQVEVAVLHARSGRH